MEKSREQIEKEYTEWLNTFNDYMDKDDGVIICIKQPDDIVKVHKALESIFGE